LRIAVADTYYPEFLTQHYRARPGLRRRPYSEQLESLMERCFGTADAYSRHLSELGHEAMEIVGNCLPLQARWAVENDGPGGLSRLGARMPLIPAHVWRDPFLRRTALAQLTAWEPDVLYVQDLSFLGLEVLGEMRAAGVFVAGQIASELPDRSVLQGFDLLLTAIPTFVERFREMGIDSERLPLGFHEGVLERLREEGVDPGPGAQREHALSFVGGIDPRYFQHRAGVELLERIASRLPLEVWGYGVDGLSPDSPLRGAYRGEAWGLDMYRVLARSRIVVNRHSPIHEGNAVNMRMFEATGTGALLFTEAMPTLSEYFEPGTEVVTYRGPDDLLEKLAHYLEHEDERRAIAVAGQARTLADHSYARRMEELEGILESRLAARVG
jgi:spore maturation protein CgeB